MRLFSLHFKIKLNLFEAYRRYSSSIPLNSEMKWLNVAEKNDAAKTIAGLLSKGRSVRREGLSVYNKIYDFDAVVQGRQSKMIMTSVSGHLLQLEFPPSYKNWNSVNPISLFDAPIRKSCSEDFQKIKRTLEREIRGCKGLIIWTDCDREGENIGFEIIEVCKAVKPNIQVFRAKFSEITTVGVNRALNNLSSPDEKMNNAVNIRSELDLRTGAALTRFQTLRLQRVFPAKIDNLISYGSCQIPTLGFVCERYKEIEAFVSEPFWKLKVTHTQNNLTVEFNWSRNRLFDKEACEEYLMICLENPTATVEKAVTKPKSKWRPQPMDTVEMEKLASRKLKLAAKDTMTIAEKLYTQGYISYPRTETNMFSKEIDLKKLVELHTPHSQWGEFANRVMAWGPNPRNGSKTDQAHPPIHPTKIATSLQGNEGRLYELITRHFLACVSKDAVGSETIVNIDIAGEKFTATGLVIHERNYLDVYVYEKWNAKEIHFYEEGQQFQPDEISMQEGATTAPPLLTEADLIALMDKNGIGTDATHAEHINTIKQRGYIGTIDKGFLVPGCIGMGLYEGYVAMDLALAKPNLRAEFEEDLKKICAGTKDFKLVLQDQILKYKEAYRIMEQRVLSLDEKMGARLNETPSQNNQNSNTPPPTASEVFKCPKCGVANIALKRKPENNFPYLSCLNYPDCKNSIWFSKDIIKDADRSDEKCPKCGNDVHKFKFMFTSMYYKVLFDVPTGWYTTCLRCNNKLRDLLAIDLDRIKSVGRIIETSNVPVAVAVAPSGSSTNPLSLQNYPTSTSNTRKSKKQSAKSAPVKKKPSNTNVRTLSTYVEAPTNVNPVGGNVGFEDDFEDLFSGEDFDMIAAAEAVESAPVTVDLTEAFDDDLEETDFSTNIQRRTTDSNNYEELFDDDFDFEFTNEVSSLPRSNNESQTATVNSMNQNHNSATTYNQRNGRRSPDEPWGSNNKNTQNASNSRTNDQTGSNSTDMTWGTKNRSNQSARYTATNSRTDSQAGSNSTDMPWGTKNSSTASTWGTSLNSRTDGQTRSNSTDMAWGTKNSGWGTASSSRTDGQTGSNSTDKAWGTRNGNAQSGWGTSSNSRTDSQAGSNCNDIAWGTKNSTTASTLGTASSSRTDGQARSNSTDMTWGTKNRNAQSGWGTSSNSRTDSQAGSNSTDMAWGTKNRSTTNNWGTSSNSRTGGQAGSNSTDMTWGTKGDRVNHIGKAFSSTRNELGDTEDMAWGTNSFRNTSSNQNSDIENKRAIKEWTEERTKIRKQEAINRRSGNFSQPSTSGNQNTNRTSQSINCPKCQASLNQLTVKKEGPNTGRQFYTCQGSCKFFEWADEISSNSGFSGDNSQNTTTQKQRAPKKCGLCRQEGHTKVKCPRKDFFNENS